MYPVAGRKDAGRYAAPGDRPVMIKRGGVPAQGGGKRCKRLILKPVQVRLAWERNCKKQEPLL